MKHTLAVLIGALFLSAAPLAMAKDYQVTGPVVDVKDDAIIVKKGSDNWEIARDKDTKTTGEIKKGDKVMIKYKMTATSIEGKEATEEQGGNRQQTRSEKDRHQDQIIDGSILHTVQQRAIFGGPLPFWLQLFFLGRFCYRQKKIENESARPWLHIPK